MELINEIIKSFGEISIFQEEKNDFFSCSYSEIPAYHLSLGLFIRNNLLRDTDRLYRLFVSSGVTDRDDMSSLILRLYWLSGR